MAPGTWVLSAYSDLYQEGYDPSPNPVTGLFQADGSGTPHDEHYKYFAGTSMSAPMVSGAAAVIRDYYTKAHDLDWISAALVKATLINSAVDLVDENNDGVDDNAWPIPNMHEGWGLVDLEAATDGSHAWVDGASIDTGMARTYRVATRPGTPLKISLVWSDHAGAAGCDVCLVNDLDLIVSHSDGTILHGNNFESGWSIADGTERDRTNNVENVFVADPQPGVWTVAIEGGNVPMGPQEFAMVIDADFDPTADVTSPTWPEPTLRTDDIGETSIALSWTDAEDDVGVQEYEIFIDAVSVASVETNEALLTNLVPNTTYEVRVEARDAMFNRSVDGPAIAVTTARDFADTNGHVFEDDIAWLAGMGITTGCDSAGNYCPDEPMTRAQMASLLARTLGLPPPGSNRFEDVSGTHSDNINAIAEQGITLGCDATGGRFCPDDEVTRAQMATFIDRAFSPPDTEGDYFADDDGSVHEGAINRVAASEITLGCNSEGSFCPDASVTRGQIAAFLHRATVNTNVSHRLNG